MAKVKGPAYEGEEGKMYEISDRDVNAVKDAALAFRGEFEKLGYGGLPEDYVSTHDGKTVSARQTRTGFDKEKVEGVLASQGYKKVSSTWRKGMVTASILFGGSEVWFTVKTKGMVAGAVRYAAIVDRVLVNFGGNL